MGKEKRRFKRYKKQTDFEIQIGDRKYPAHMCDYSLDGLCVMIDGFPPLKSGDIVNLNVQNVGIKASGRVMRLSRTDAGMKLGIQRMGMLLGTLHDFHLSDIMLGLQRSLKTGVLHVRSGGIQKSVSFDSGVMVFANSNLNEDRLGDMLVREGRITPEQYETSSAVLRQTGKRHGTVLVEMGYITPKELFDSVKRSVQSIILSMFGLREGEFIFREGILTASEVITLKLSAATLIYSGIKRIEDIQIVKGMAPAGHMVLYFSTDPLDLFQEIQLDESDKQLLKAVNGKRTYKEVVAECGLDPFMAMRIINALVATRIIETDEDRILEKPAPSKGTATAEAEDDEVTAEDVLGAGQQKVSELDMQLKINQLFAEHRRMGYYGVLGVSEKATRAEIKTAYYQAARQFHPDRHFSLPPEMKDKLNTIFTYITTAYSTLASPALRAEYDKRPKDVDEDKPVDPIEQASEKFKVAQALERKGRVEEASRYYAEAAYLNAEDPSYHFHGSLALGRLGKHKDADRALQRAIKLDPFNPDYIAEEGHNYIALGFFKRAKSSFEKALKLQPLNRRALEGIQKLPPPEAEQ